MAINEIDDNEEYYSALDSMDENENLLPEFEEGEDNDSNYDDLDSDVYDFDNADGIDDENDDSYIDSVFDIDFSGVSGSNFKKSIRKVNSKLKQKAPRRAKRRRIPGKGKPLSRPKPTIAQPLRRKIGKKQPPKPLAPKPKPLSRRIPLEENTTYKVRGEREKKLSKVIVPDDRKVIIKGASDFILSQKSQVENIKSIQYYKGKKLKPLVITISNNDPTDFNLELFNPSMPLDYLYSTSNNLNSRVQIAGGNVSYTDVLYNMLANPILIINAQTTISGANINGQNKQPLFFRNKNIEGYEFVNPVNLDLKIDTMQVFNDIIYFNIFNTLNRAFVPDGMDVIGYKVLPGNTVTITFWYTQVSLKKFFYDEARKSKSLL